MYLLASACVCTRKTVQVRRCLGHRLSFSHNLRPDGISRNACSCNRTIGTGGCVRSEMVEIGQRRGYRGLEGRERQACRDVQVSVQLHAYRGESERGVQETVKGRQGTVKDAGAGWDAGGRRWEARGWHSAVSSVCAYMPSCVIDSLRKPAASCHTVQLPLFRAMRDKPAIASASPFLFSVFYYILLAKSPSLFLSRSLISFLLQRSASLNAPLSDSLKTVLRYNTVSVILENRI